jgi:hypothetical protein
VEKTTHSELYDMCTKYFSGDKIRKNENGRACGI